MLDWGKLSKAFLIDHVQPQVDTSVYLKCVCVQKTALGTKGSDLYAALWLETPSSSVILAASPLLERLT